MVAPLRHRQTYSHRATSRLYTLLTNARGAECPQLVEADAAPTQHSAPRSAPTGHLACLNSLLPGHWLTASEPGPGTQRRLPTYRNCLRGDALVHYAGCEQKKGTAPSLPPTKDTPHAPQSALLSMSNRSAHLHRLARVCGARAAYGCSHESADSSRRSRSGLLVHWRLTRPKSGKQPSACRVRTARVAQLNLWPAGQASDLQDAPHEPGAPRAAIVGACRSLRIVS